MRDQMERALQKSRAEYTEIRVEQTFSSWMTFRGPELDNIGSSSAVGGIVRSYVKGGWGMATNCRMYPFPALMPSSQG